MGSTAVLRKPVSQSAPELQPLSIAHLVEQEPPQSAAVSVPSLTLFVQLTHLVSTQLLLLQSLLLAQVLASTHLGQFIDDVNGTPKALRKVDPQLVSVLSPDTTPYEIENRIQQEEVEKRNKEKKKRRNIRKKEEKK